MVTFTREALYPKLEIGQFQGKSQLEVLLEQCSIPYDNFICKVDSVKVSLISLSNLLFRSPIAKRKLTPSPASWSSIAVASRLGAIQTGK